jgi:hypothetical protein
MKEYVNYKAVDFVEVYNLSHRQPAVCFGKLSCETPIYRTDNRQFVSENCETPAGAHHYFVQPLSISFTNFR